jgi:hypothetical protein
MTVINKRAPKRKAVGGYHTTTTAIKNTHANIASGCKKRHTAPKCCATFCSTPELLGLVLKNIVSEHGAFTHALSWVFSRPNTLVSGRDGLVREAGRMACSMFLTSRPPFARKNADGGFQSQHGAEAMTKVNTTTTPKKGNTIPLARQQAIETALSTALWLIRHPNQTTVNAATGFSIRAASMLKQACAEYRTGGAA